MCLLWLCPQYLFSASQQKNTILELAGIDRLAPKNISMNFAFKIALFNNMQKLNSSMKGKETLISLRFAEYRYSQRRRGRNRSQVHFPHRGRLSLPWKVQILLIKEGMTQSQLMFFFLPLLLLWSYLYALAVPRKGLIHSQSGTPSPSPSNVAPSPSKMASPGANSSKRGSLPSG